MPARIYTVLLADNSPELRKIVRERYEATGFVVVGEAENGSVAIELAIKHHPDLIVLDLAMPVMNGLRATPELLRVVPKPIIILFTLYADSAAIRSKALAAGINQVVSKSDLTELIGKSQALTRDLE